MKAIKNLNKLLITIIVLLILGLIVLPFISKEDNDKEPDTNNKETPKKSDEQEEIKLTDEEILDLLIIYKSEAYEFIINKEKENKYKVERKNINTNHIDMVFEVDAITGNVKIKDIKPVSNSAGGGSSNE